MEITQLTIVPITIGLVAVARKLGIPTRFAPFTSLVVAIVLSGLLSGFNSVSFLTGIVLGLTSCGLYSGVKTTKNS